MPQIAVLIISALMVLGGVAYNNEKTQAVGASQTISSLTELTSLSHNDVLPITEANGLTTKKVKWGTATSSMKTIFDPIYSPIGGSASLVTLGNVTTGTWNADTLTVSKGGTGSTSLIAYQLLAGNGTGAVTTFGNGASGYILTSNGAGALPSFQNVGVTTGGNNTWTGTNTFTATTTFSATSTFSGNVSSVAFGGRGTDGALVVTSGTTTISAGGAEVLVKEYTSISITGTGHLAFSTPDANGTIIYLKSQGNVTLTCSVAPCISTEGMGGAAGTGSAGTEGSEQNCGSAGTSINDVFASTAGHGGSCGNQTDAAKAGGAGGAILANLYEYTVSSQRLITRGIKIVAGSGGAGGSGSRVQTLTGTAGGAGGAGGGALYMEVGGYLNLTTTGAISTSGIAGSNGTSLSNSAYNLAAGSGGGGGSAGMVVVLYNGLIANSGSVISSGGVGGTGGSCTDTAGGAGGNVSNSGNGGGGGGSYGGAGGAGGAGGTNNTSANGANGGSGNPGSGGGGGGGATCAYNLSSSQTGGSGGGSSSLTALFAQNFYF